MKNVRHQTAVPINGGPYSQPDIDIQLTPERIDEFLSDCKAKNRGEETINAYHQTLMQLYSYLPEDKKIRRDTLWEWRSFLLSQGYAAGTVNLRITVANGFLAFCGRREYQLCERVSPDGEIQPELTRVEYLRLLSTARAQDKRVVYLLIKIFGSMGLSVKELPLLTVEAAESGILELPLRAVRIPPCLQKELLEYSRQQEISSGMIFITRNGKPLSRVNVTKRIQSLGEDARVEQEKSTPRCLKKLYQKTRSDIEQNFSLLIEQAHDSLLEAEQLSIGWEQN